MSATCKMCKILIENKRYGKEDMLKKIDLFLLANRITEEEYKELINILENNA